MTIENFLSPEYRFLSNFGECPKGVLYENILYSTAEHAYQAAKTNDLASRQYISMLLTPGQAKRAGKKVTLRPDWEKIKVREMRKIIGIKFLRDPELCEKLLATGDAELVEGNTWGDKFWGVCGGEGENHLGKCLMEFRKFLKSFSAFVDEIPNNQ